jgi:hypothetical protein
MNIEKSQTFLPGFAANELQKTLHGLLPPIKPQLAFTDFVPILFFCYFNYLRMQTRKICPDLGLKTLSARHSQ